MRLSKRFRTICAVFMAVWMTNLPAQVWAAKKMIPTTVVVNQMTRAEAQNKIQHYLSEDKIRKALEERGLSVAEVNSRLASLSDHEMQDLAGQIEQARYGGDVLVTILLIVLIIFLIKRI